MTEWLYLQNFHVALSHFALKLNVQSMSIRALQVDLLLGSIGHSVPVFLFGIHGVIILLHPRTLWNVNILVPEVVLKVL